MKDFTCFNRYSFPTSSSFIIVNYLRPKYSTRRGRTVINGGHGFNNWRGDDISSRLTNRFSFADGFHLRAKLNSIDKRPLFLQIWSSFDPATINVWAALTELELLPISSMYSTFRWRICPWRMLYAVFGSTSANLLIFNSIGDKML